MRDILALWCVLLAMRLTTQGDPYDYLCQVENKLRNCTRYKMKDNLKEYRLVRYVDMYPTKDNGMMVETIVTDGSRLFIDMDDFNKAYALRLTLNELIEGSSIVVWSDEDGKIYFEEEKEDA